MKKLSIIGLYCNNTGVVDGQTVKTNILTEELESILGKDEISRINTYNWKKRPFRLVVQCIAAVRRSHNVIFMTDAGGIKVFPWLLRLANILNHCAIHYVVVGGWLIHYLEKNKFICRCLKHISGVYVETNVMMKSLNRLGLDNVYLMPNCKPLEILEQDQMACYSKPPYRFCIFSRIMKEKGIEEAIHALQFVNEQCGFLVCTLDIYGQVDMHQTQWFEELSKTFPEGVRYCGVVPFHESVETIKKYFALLFPTKFYTEGVPGTIIDAYAAGVPVIASKWESFEDVIEHGVTGIGYPFSQTEALEDILLDLVQHPDRIQAMRMNCLKKAQEYLPEQVLPILLEKLK